MNDRRTFAHENSSRDDLDVLLRRWHEVNAERAAAGRAELMRKLDSPLPLGEGPGVRADRVQSLRLTHELPASKTSPQPSPRGRGSYARYLRAAASLALLATLIVLLIPTSSTNVFAGQREILVPEAGRLDALDNEGNILGPCALKHTKVHADISGPFTRVTVTQQYHNPYDHKIEAVYTFPLSHRGAVDRMIMTIGDRVIQAEMKERQEARQMYESARASGYVASLLEQERPNIFTQSVANIEPGAEIEIEISYVEMLESRDGVYSFEFPMVVAPRYIPGSPLATASHLPAELNARHGVILLGPAKLTLGQPGSVEQHGTLQEAKLEALLTSAHAIQNPGMAGSSWWGQGANAKLPEVWYPFEAAYCDGSKELGFLLTDGTGQINNRWFYCDPPTIKNMGAGFGQDTDQVSDASRITPMPVRPPTRAGHDISLTVNIDTGGPVIVDYKSDLHEIVSTDQPKHENGDKRLSLALKNQRELPNRDFVLSWRTLDDRIQEAVFTHASDRYTSRMKVTLPPELCADGNEGDVEFVDDRGFFTIILAPPQRVENTQVVPRELIFVLDTSGSMSGEPIEKAKQVMARAIDTMRPDDTFNMITFSGDTHILWDRPRKNTEKNRAEAQAFLESRQGGGGTEMMTAINAALAPTSPPQDDQHAALTPLEVANLPADGRHVTMRVSAANLGTTHDVPFSSFQVFARDQISFWVRLTQRADVQLNAAKPWTVSGTWSTIDGERVLADAILEQDVEIAMGVETLRIVMFLTDGQVGNDDAIIQAVRTNAATTRVFSFGVGNSPNRSLLDGMAKAGRGEVAYVNLQSNADEAVQQFVKRIETPVLTNIALRFDLPEGVTLSDVVPPLDAVPDLFDVKPLILHGRYTKPQGGAGEASARLTITGQTGEGAYSRTLDINLPSKSDDHTVVPTLWARARVDEYLKDEQNAQQRGDQNAAAMSHGGVIALGVHYSIMTPYTSFVAVEKARLTIAGKPVLVPVPIELPEGMQWEGVFGEDRPMPHEGRADINGDGVANAGTASSLHAPVVTADDLLAIVNQYGTVDGENAESRFGWKAQAGTMLHFQPNSSLHQLGMQLNTTNGMLAIGPVESLGEIPIRGREFRYADESAPIGVTTGNIRLINPLQTSPQLATQQPFVGYATTTSGQSPTEGKTPITLGMPQFANSPTLDLDTALRGQMREHAGIAIAGKDVVGGGGGFGGGGGGGSGDAAASIDLSGLTRAESAQSPMAFERERRTRESQINHSLLRAGELAREKKTAEALQVIDEILFIDAENPAALALKGAIEGPEINIANTIVRQRLETMRIPIVFQNHTLEQIIAFLKQVSGVNIYADVKSLEQIGVKTSDTVWLELENASIIEILNGVLGQLGKPESRPEFRIAEGIVIITVSDAAPEGPQPTTEVNEAVRKQHVAQQAALKREGRLRRVIDRRLWEFVSMKPALDDPALTPALSQRERELRVVILTRDTANPVINAMKAAGLQVDDMSTAPPLVAGRIAPARLEDVAMIDGVRRIEPVNMN